MMVFQDMPHLMGPAAPGAPSPVLILARLAVDLGHTPLISTSADSEPGALGIESLAVPQSPLINDLA